VSDQTTALQDALAAEHAVIWGYGVLGAHLSGAQLATAQAADTAHRDRRDAVTAMVRQLGVAPVTAEPAYRLPFAVTDRASALRLAARLEDGAAAAWWYLVGAADAEPTRRFAVHALTDAAVRATGWRLSTDPGRAPAPFPGQP
jgi:hypothetical protein